MLPSSGRYPFPPFGGSLVPFREPLRKSRKWGAVLPCIPEDAGAAVSSPASSPQRVTRSKSAEQGRGENGSPGGGEELARVFSDDGASGKWAVKRTDIGLSR